MKTTVIVLLLAFAIMFANAARVLDEDDSTLPVTGPNPVVAPLGGVAPVGTGPIGPIPTGTSGVSPVGTNPGAVSTAVGSVPTGNEMVFFMHDILGGTNPTAVAVTGIAANPAASGQVAFAKPNGANLPINNGVPVNSNNNGIVNNNNIPFLAGLSGNVGNVVQNNGNNNFFNTQSGVSVVNGGSGSSGSLLQKLTFGTLTVIDDELTEGNELESGLIGKAQGFYIASDVDGKGHTMAFTAMFENGGYSDSISFFGVLRTAVSESQIAIMGGTGKYVNAKGFATVKVFSENNQQQQTDGVETLLQFTVYLAY
ncbi:hypothetical protein ACFE04_014922 [Oxalis oulophora]